MKLMEMDKKMVSSAAKEGFDFEGLLLDLFVSKAFSSKVPSILDWDPMAYFDFE